MEKHWCMCKNIGAVARDGFSTCSKCGGKDAYGKGRGRPLDKEKNMVLNKLSLEELEKLQAKWNKVDSKKFYNSEFCKKLKLICKVFGKTYNIGSETLARSICVYRLPEITLKWTYEGSTNFIKTKPFIDMEFSIHLENYKERKEEYKNGQGGRVVYHEWIERRENAYPHRFVPGDWQKLDEIDEVYHAALKAERTYNIDEAEKVRQRLLDSMTT